MLQINTMRTSYRLAGGSAERAQLARRLDRVVTDRFGDVLDGLVGELARDDGPVYLIRRLRLSLWLNTARLDDAAISRRWAEAMARALHRQILDGDAEVMRYDSQADYLASWVIDLLNGRADGSWQYEDFAVVHDQPIGRAVAHILSRQPQSILPVFEILRTRRQLARLVATLGWRDVQLIWQSLTGRDVEVVGSLPTALLELMRGVSNPGESERLTDADGRARRALHWLLAYTSPPASMVPEVAARAALAVTAIEAIVAAVPALTSALRHGDSSSSDLVGLLAHAPGDLDRQVRWLTGLLTSTNGRETVVRLIEIGHTGSSAAPAVDPDAERRSSGYAGLALLLPALRETRLDERLGAGGIRDLLASVFVGADQALAYSDPVLRWFVGLPEGLLRDQTIDWPTAAELGIDASVVQSSDGDGAHAPALRVVLDRFCDGLRARPGSSRPYLRDQFFHRRGIVTRTDGTLRVQLQPVPLRILLSLAGRLGDQGRIDWIDRRLIIEVSDG